MADFVFDKESLLTYQKDNNNPNSDYEKPYIITPITEMEVNDMGNLPALIKMAPGNSFFSWRLIQRLSRNVGQNA